MQHNCPVCHKAGLPDFKANATICPQCNSDLKPFLLLHSISKSKPSLQIYFAIAGLALITCILAIFYFNNISNGRQIPRHTSNSTKNLYDSIHLLNFELAERKLSNSNRDLVTEEIEIKYKVKNGDCLSKIAAFFYNDWKMYRKISVDNKLSQPNMLKVGQLLTIKIKKG